MEDTARRIEEQFAEITFAGERESRHLKSSAGRFGERLDNLFTAATFAEAGEFDTAGDCMGGVQGIADGPLPPVCPAFARAGLGR